jgi:hypothetical protein
MICLLKVGFYPVISQDRSFWLLTSGAYFISFILKTVFSHFQHLRSWNVLHPMVYILWYNSFFLVHEIMVYLMFESNLVYIKLGFFVANLL